MFRAPSGNSTFQDVLGMADTLSYRNTHNLSRCNRTAIGSGVSPPRTCRAASILRTVQARSADNTDAGASEGIGSPVHRPMFLQVVTFQRRHQALCRYLLFG